MMDRLYEAAHAYNEQVAQLERLARKSPPHILIIAPDEMPPAKFITRSKKKINKTIDLGYQWVDKIENRLRNFLSKAPGIGDTPDALHPVMDRGVTGLKISGDKNDYRK